MDKLVAVKSFEMRLFPSSLTKNSFSWFFILGPNYVHSWAQLKRSFHDQFFKGDMKVGLIDLFIIRRMYNKSIDDYLVRFTQWRIGVLCLFQKLSHQNGCWRSGLIYQKETSQSTLSWFGSVGGEKVRQIEQLKAEKVQKKQKNFLKREKVNFVEAQKSNKEENVDDCEIDVVELKESHPYTVRLLSLQEPKKEWIMWIRKYIHSMLLNSAKSLAFY